MNKKSIKELAWDVPEEVYRADEAISYSGAASFEREGPASIINTEKKDSPALRFGSLVDTMLTDAAEFDNKYIVSSMEFPKDAMVTALNRIWQTYRIPALNLITDAQILTILDALEYFKHWLPNTRIKDIREKGSQYYSLLPVLESKVVVSAEDFNEAKGCVDALLHHPTIGPLFVDDEFDKEIESFYQLKFRTTLLIPCHKFGVKTPNLEEEIPVRCMFDRLIVNHRLKTIQPIDLKTTGHSEEVFESSFFAWNYYLQATLYTDILKELISTDEYFHDFTVLPFQFVVVNRKQQLPLVWEFNREEFEEYAKQRGIRTYPELLAEMYWHMTSSVFNVSRVTFESNGFRKIRFKLYNNNGLPKESI